MSFRQHNKNAGVLWRKKNRHELLTAGLPESIVDSEHSWGYTLLHGNDHYQSGWDTSRITKEEAEQLLCLLNSQSFWVGIGYDIYPELKRRVDSN